MTHFSTSGVEVGQKFSQVGWKPIRYSDDGELYGGVGFHVDDFLIGLADGVIGEKWLSEIQML